MAPVLVALEAASCLSQTRMSSRRDAGRQRQADTNGARFEEVHKNTRFVGSWRLLHLLLRREHGKEQKRFE